MKSLVHRLMFVGLAVAIALPFAAAQEKEKKKGGGGPIAELKKAIGEIDLTADQQKKIETIIEEHRPKVAEAVKKAGDAPKMIAEARKRLKDEGKKGKELNDGAVAAAKLSDDQKAGYEALQKATQDLRAAVAAVLNDEQKEKAGLAKGKKKKKNQ